MERKTHLKLVTTVEELELTPNEHDLHLPHLGKLYFIMQSDDGDGRFLIYVKKEHMSIISYGNGLESGGVVRTPYCYTHVTLNSWDRFFGISLRKKVTRCLSRFKKFLIEEDLLVARTKLTSRYIKV